VSGLLLNRMIANLDPKKKKSRAKCPPFLPFTNYSSQFKCPKGTFNAAVVATLRRHYPERFPTEKD
jgi:hypothetical protein